MIYFCSDPHYNHKNIVRGVTDWEHKDACRPFDTLNDHNATLINNINAVVEEDDTLYCLGDWAFGGAPKIVELRKKIKCKTVHLILGNHDKHIRQSSTYQSLFTSVSEYKEIKVEGQTIILSHYAMRVWNGSHRGTWMLYGHSHGTLDEMKPQFANPNWIGDDYYSKSWRTMDVGFDTHKEFRPYSFKEISDLMEKRDILLSVDHHDNKTRNK